MKKTKISFKKLVLAKDIVSALSERDAGKVMGGATTSCALTCTCPNSNCECDPTIRFCSIANC